MKKNAYKRMDFARFVDDYPENFNELVEVSEVQKQTSAVDAVIKEIYAPDPRTGLPTGDIGYYVSDKANPEIKAFILEQLFMDTSAASNPKGPANMSDEDLLVLSRQLGESPQDYMNRLNSEVDTFKKIADEYAKPIVSNDKVQKQAFE